MYISISIAALAIQASTSPGLTEALNSVGACAEQQLNCIGGQCLPSAVENLCEYSALSPRAEAIVRTETLGLATRLSTAATPATCQTELAGQMQEAMTSLEVDGPLTLAEPYAVSSNDSGFGDAFEQELFWRAQLDERLTSQSGMRMQSGEASACDVPAFAMVVQLRAQNLAFAERYNALERAENGALSDPAKWAVWFVYHHSDLWQDEQAEAADVFTELAADDTFSNGMASNLQNRVAGHQPLYSDDQLIASWSQN